MRSVSRLTLFVPLAVLAISCASSEQLARRSDAELKSGQTERAYQTAVVALKHKPGNPTATAALNRAAAVLAEGRRARVRRLAATDTLPAAREALDLESFRHEVTRLGGDVPDDPGFASDEHAIRDAAAALDYASAERALHEDQAKDAYRWFAEVNRFHAGFRDVSRRLDDTYARAEVRLAVLPFEDADEVPSIACTRHQR